MIVRCAYNTGELLGAPTRPAFHNAATEFPLLIGSEYQAMGVGIFETTTLVLLVDETKKPNWLPIGLFGWQEGEFPPGWHFAVLDGPAASGVRPPEGWVILWGYRELVTSAQHREGLIERDPQALAIFFRRLSGSWTG